MGQSVKRGKQSWKSELTISSESERKTSSNSKGGSYPKRNQNCDNIFEWGEQQSTGKMKKLDNSAGMSQFWEGGSTSTVSEVQNSTEKDTKSGVVGQRYQTQT